MNDGSSDGTQQILEKEAQAFTGLHVLRTASSRRDIRRIPALLNLGMAEARARSRSGLPKFMMISGDDNWLAPSYASAIVERMEADPRLVVASGSWLGRAGRTNQMPHGGGRFVRSAFMEAIGGEYPVAYGWEAWILYKALQRGCRVKNFPDLRYRHLRPYSPRNLVGWGRGMFSLGFPTAFVASRFVINMLWVGRGTQSRRASVSMVAGYLSAKLNPGKLGPNLIDDRALKVFVRRYSLARLTRRPW